MNEYVNEIMDKIVSEQIHNIEEEPISYKWLKIRTPRDIRKKENISQIDIHLRQTDNRLRI